MTRRESACERFAAALFEPATPHEAALDSHAASCLACREVSRAHGLARALSDGAPDPGSLPIGLAQVVGTVRRRRAARAAAGTLALAAVCAALVWTRPLPRAAPATADVFALMDEVEGFARRDVVREDASYAAFGAIATWVAPQTAHALDAPLSRRAAADLTTLDEDEREVAP